ncbi:hypothetical protein [Brevibacillus brevis]|nr:hypothetical protein [Brevibacillus brevis]
MKDFLKKHKKSVLLIITGGLAITSTYFGIDEEAQMQILKAIKCVLQ